MMEVLAHRGPDGAATWLEDAVGLGHLMLYATPESLHERQPCVSASGNLVLVADVRLDNRDDLVRTLRPPRRHDGPVTDAELILAAYERWGEACPEQLIGDFAFALWDAGAQRLFCARDPFGVKPFYYHHTPGRLFAFGSELRALLELDEVEGRPNDVRLADHLLVPVRQDASQTHFEGIYSILPAHSLTVDATGVRERRYWDLDPKHELRLSSDAAYAEGLRAHFTEAVRCRLRSAFPVGAMLSGGIDSSSIVGVAAQLRRQEGGPRLHTFTALFTGIPQCDERPYVDAVLKRHDAEAHFFNGDDQSPLGEIDQLQDVVGRPVSGGNLFINWNLYRTAREHGVRVLMEGFDGDTVISHGLGYFFELRNAGRWIRLVREVKALAETLGEPWRPAVMSWIKAPLYTRLGLVALQRSLRRRRPARTGTAAPWRYGVNPAFVQRVADHLDLFPEKPATERQNHYELLMRPYMSFIMGDLYDPVAAACAVDVRFPFFDRRLVEYCLSLPPEQKLQGGWSRLVMRRAMEGILPPEIQWRGAKSNYEPAFQRGLLTFERERLQRLVRSNTGDVARYVDLAQLDAIYRKILSEEATQRERVFLWKSLSLALWLQRLETPINRATSLSVEVMRSSAREPTGTV